MHLSTSQKQQIKDKVQECLDLYAKKKNKVFPMPPVHFFLKGTKGGYHQGGELYFNETLAAENFHIYMSDVVGHETAHYIQRKIYPQSSSHGAEWKTIMWVLGLKAERCHTMDITNARARVYQTVDTHCKCKTHKLTLRKAKQMFVLSCKLCGGRLNPGPLPTKEVLNKIIPIHFLGDDEETQEIQFL